MSDIIDGIPKISLKSALLENNGVEEEVFFLFMPVSVLDEMYPIPSEKIIRINFPEIVFNLDNDSIQMYYGYFSNVLSSMEEIPFIFNKEGNILDPILIENKDNVLVLEKIPYSIKINGENIEISILSMPLEYAEKMLEDFDDELMEDFGLSQTRFFELYIDFIKSDVKQEKFYVALLDEVAIGYLKETEMNSLSLVKI